MTRALAACALVLLALLSEYPKASGVGIDIAFGAGDRGHRLSIGHDLEGLLPALELVHRHHDNRGLSPLRDDYVFVARRHVINNVRQVLACFCEWQRLHFC